MKTHIQEKIDLISLPVNSTIRQAMQVIDRGALGMALLIKNTDKHFAGLVTDGDIRRALLNGAGLESSVRDIRNATPKTARKGMTAKEIAALFSEPVRVVPILDEQNRVVDLALFDRRVRLPVAEPYLGDKELQYVMECVLTGWVSSAGEFVTRFEEMYADFCQTRYAIATSSGTTALHLAVLAADIGPGDEVIVPTLSFIASANAVTYTEATPVFVDCDSTYWTLDTEKVKAAITPRTKAIIPVHLYGHPADMNPILEIARQHNLLIIEDAAEAHGALYRGKPVGSLGDIGIFSFYGNKIVTTGEGGMIVTNREDFAEKMRLLRAHGMSKTNRYWHDMIGYNYRLTNIQAALGVAQMEKVEDILQQKLTIAATYTEGLKGIPGLTLPVEATWARNVYWLYTILIDPVITGITRDELMQKLQEQDIETRPFFPPMHIQPVYSTGQSLPVAENISKRGISLPGSVNLSANDLQRIIQTIKKVLKANA